MNIILTSPRNPNPIDADHVFVCIGPNCWGISPKTAQEAYKNAKHNAPSGARNFVTKVAHKSAKVSPIDGYVSWDSSHDAKNCELCTAGKVRVELEK